MTSDTFCPASAKAEDNLESLLTLARTKKLYNNRYWHILLHYKKTFSKTKSLIDDPSFFLSPHGKTNPKAEIEAAIKTFFSTDQAAAKPTICRFYARYIWLKKMLGVDKETVPVVTCKKIDSIHPKSATLVFPTYYLNNPASMFGHTLLLIETDYKNKRLSQAVNYAARVDDTNGLVFTIKGIFGMCHGFYTVMPYYKKICIDAGNHDDDGFFQHIGFRPAFTDLLDTDFFHNQGIHIEFLDTSLRYYTSDHRIQLNHIDLIDIVFFQQDWVKTTVT